MTRLSTYLVLGLLIGAHSGCRTDPEESPFAHPATVPSRVVGQTFVLLMLTDQPPQLEAEAAEELQRQHLAHIRSMVQSGKVLIAGPFAQRDDERLRGALIFDCSIDEARTMANNDPAVKAGRLKVICMTWMADNALMFIPGQPSESRPPN